MISSCSIFQYEIPLERLSIYVDKNANNKAPVALDLVIVCDENLGKEIGSLTAAQYFEKKNELITANADNIMVWHWEVVPGQQLKNVNIKFEEFNPVCGYVFASYASEKMNRIKLPSAEEIKIILKKSEFQVTIVKTEVSEWKIKKLYFCWDNIKFFRFIIYDVFKSF